MTAAEHTRFRERRLRLAVVFSLASKVSNAALQVVSLPLAAIALGAHDFALYALMLAMAGWLGLANLGLGPSLLKRMTTARVNLMQVDVAGLFGSALLPNLLISALLAGLFLTVVWSVPVGLLLGDEYQLEQQVARIGLTALAVCFIFQSNLGISESAQLAMQEQHLTNVSTAAGAVLAGVMVFAVATYAATPVWLLLAVCIPPLVARCVNAGLFMRRHPEVFVSSLRFATAAKSRSMIKEGLTFSIAGGAGSFLAHILPITIVGRFSSSYETANFAAVMNALIIASGVVGMVTVPMWGALSDGIARRDFVWINRSYRRLLVFGMGVGLLFASIFVFYGSWLFAVWYRGALAPDRWLLVAAGIYFLANCWENIHWTMAVGTGAIRSASVMHFARALVGIALILYAAPNGGLSSGAYVFWIMAGSVLLVSAAPMWWFAKQSMRGS